MCSNHIRKPWQLLALTCHPHDWMPREGTMMQKIETAVYNFSFSISCVGFQSFEPLHHVFRWEKSTGLEIGSSQVSCFIPFQRVWVKTTNSPQDVVFTKVSSLVLSCSMDVLCFLLKPSISPQHGGFTNHPPANSYALREESEESLLHPPYN